MKASIPPIVTEAEYEAALAEAGEIFDAEPSTPEGDRLDALITAIEAYEDIHYPFPEPSPDSIEMRRVDAQEAVRRIRRQSTLTGLDTISDEEIEDEIRRTREARKTSL